MASTTVAQLAVELNRSPAALLEQLQSAGVSKASTDDSLTESDKERLLNHLRTSHGTMIGTERKKITVMRKSTSEIKQADSSGKARTIQVEVRKKRTFIKRDEPGANEPGAPVVDDAELTRREEEASAQAELLRRQEEDLAETRRVREEQEAQERAAAEAHAREASEKLVRKLPLRRRRPTQLQQRSQLHRLHRHPKVRRQSRRERLLRWSRPRSRNPRSRRCA